MNDVKKFFGLCALVAVAALQSGCGGGETNAPAVKLTASVIASQQDATAHTHVVSIPFTDISPAPVSDVYQYRSEITDGHSHVIAISKQQMTDLDNGMQLVLKSSSPSSGTDHTHTWDIRGGDVLYDQNCYNCHTNDKRGHNPMNVSFNASQTNAVKNPGSAQLSTAPAPVPDPNFAPSTVVSLDGPALYAANCSRCHNPLSSSTKFNKTFSQIKGAISANAGGMASLGTLTDAQLQAIAAALIH